MEEVVEDVSWKRSWRRLLGDVLGMSLGRCLEDVSWNTSWWPLKKVRHDFHFRLIQDVFETKIKTFLRLCDVFVSTGIRMKLVEREPFRVIFPKTVKLADTITYVESCWDFMNASKTYQNFLEDRETGKLLTSVNF